MAGNEENSRLFFHSRFFFPERRHPDHEPLQKALLKSQIEKWNQDVVKKSSERQGRAAAKENRPVAAVRPSRGKSAPPKKAPATIPITPNVLKKRTMPRPTPFKRDLNQFVFKAKPAPAIHKQHKSCGNLNRIPAPCPVKVKAATKDLEKLTLNAAKTSSSVTTSAAAASRRTTTTTANKENEINRPKGIATATAITRPSRQPMRATKDCAPHQPRVRSNSAPGKSRTTVPVTPMVLKRNGSRTRLTSQGDGKQQQAGDQQQYHFKAKPAEVLHRKPFKPKLAVNNNTGPVAAAAAPCPTKPFEFCLEGRLKDRKTFNHRSTDAFERKQKEVEEQKKKAADDRYLAARRMTNFRATRNPFK